MTVSRSIDAAHWRSLYGSLEREAERSPKGPAAELVRVVDEAERSVRGVFELHGYTADPADRTEEFVGLILRHLIESNESFRGVVHQAHTPVEREWRDEAELPGYVGPGNL